MVERRFVTAPGVLCFQPGHSPLGDGGGALAAHSERSAPALALNFSWRQPHHTAALASTSSQLLNFIRSPINLSFLGDGFGGNDGANANSASPKGPSTSQQAMQQEQPQTNRQLRFPPWSNRHHEQHSQQQQHPQHAHHPADAAHAALPANHNTLITVEQGQTDESSCIAVEADAGHRRRVMYRHRSGTTDSPSPASPSLPWEGFDIVQERQSGQDHARALVAMFLLPNGFPESVAPQYAHYMGWRGVQYFFGGAISVFTTQSLLGALGVAGRFTGEAAAAINWVIKDGAGRLGRLLFARWGRELDCELKQFRLAGDLLMEGGAAMELATVFVPRAFLPLACTANLAKNLAAVAASSTRAPIYRTFALQNNLADVTAKGESVANLADILGTVAGIALSKARLPLLPTFCVLSVGYLIASRKEVDSVELPYYNRARLAYATAAYLARGSVPGVAEANQGEPLLPWGTHNQGRILLGSSVEAACAGPADLRAAAELFRGCRYMLAYRPDQRKVCVLLHEGATSLDCLRASFLAHVFLHLLDGKPLTAPRPMAQPPARPTKAKGGGGGARPAAAAPTAPAWQPAMARAKEVSELLYPDFMAQTEQQGWKLQQTMLNPKETRILKLQLQPLTV